jgi:hypothetical protein
VIYWKITWHFDQADRTFHSERYSADLSHSCTIFLWCSRYRCEDQNNWKFWWHSTPSFLFITCYFSENSENDTSNRSCPLRIGVWTCTLSVAVWYCQFFLIWPCT